MLPAAWGASRYQQQGARDLFMPMGGACRVPEWPDGGVALGAACRAPSGCSWGLCLRRAFRVPPAGKGRGPFAIPLMGGAGLASGCFLQWWKACGAESSDCLAPQAF